MMKKFSVTFIALLLVGSLTIMMVSSDIHVLEFTVIDIATSFADGSGTLEDPYMIYDVHDLQNMSSDLSAHYALANDIDASETWEWNWNGSAYNGFEPVGDSDNRFTGSFDGLGHTINGLYINRSTNGIALFGYVGEGGVVCNIGLVEIIINGNSGGGVAGLVGVNAGTVNNSYSIGKVVGYMGVAGLVGWNSGTVNNSYSIGDVEGTSYVGGLVGSVSITGTIENSYASVNVVERERIFAYILFVGGLAGSNDGTIVNSYSTGNVYAAESHNGLPFGNMGGLVGSNSGTVTNSHYNVDTVLINNAHHVTLGGLYNTQYDDWIANDLYLDIADYSDTLVPIGDGYMISEIQGFKDLLGFSGEGYAFQLGADIDLSSSPNHYIPLFRGIFDGKNHTLYNFYVNQPFSTVVGLFGNIGTGSQVRNVVLFDINVTGYWFVGGLVGYNNFGILENTYIEGHVKGSSQVGMLAGYNREGNIYDTYTFGKITRIEVPHGSMDIRYAGGLVGYNREGKILRSYSSCDVDSTGFSANGGLVGGNHGIIGDSYATGYVSGGSAGGLVGENIGTVENSYATGTVIGGDHVGGLVGSNGYGTVEDSYATGTVSGSVFVGGFVGSNTGIVVNTYATGDVSGGGHVGGLVGANHYGGNVLNSYATGEVEGTIAVGGLVGWMLGQSSSVATSFSTGMVTGNNFVGGLIGGNGHDTPIVLGGAVSDSYSIGDVTRKVDSSGTIIGGFIGFNFNGNIINCYSTGSVHYEGAADPTDKGFAGEVVMDGDYEMTGNFWDVETSEQTDTAGNATGKTTTEMMDISTFSDAGWDIAAVDSTDERDMDSIWNIVDHETYPFFSWEGFTLKIFTLGNGTVDIEPQRHTYPYGMEVIVTALSDVGWYFSHWSGDVPEGQETNEELTIVMDNDKTITAHFYEIYHNLTISVEGEGTTEPGEGNHSYAYGTEVNITSIPDEGWYFSHWTGDVPEGQEENEELTIVMDADKNITAHFLREEYTLEITAEGEGVTDPPAGIHVYEFKDEVTVTATPETGWRFSHWGGDVPEGEEESEEITIVMDGDKNITAHFDRIYHNLTIVVEGEGTTSIEEGNHSYAYGTEVNLTATPDEGWYFSHWSGDVPENESDESSITIVIYADKNITAHFYEIIPPSIEITSPYDGEEFDTDIVTVEWSAEEGTYQISHYEIRLNDGEWINVGIETNHTFTVTEPGDHVVSVRVFDVEGNSDVDSTRFAIEESSPGSYWWLILLLIIVVVAIILVMNRGKGEESFDEEDTSETEEDAVGDEEV